MTNFPKPAIAMIHGFCIGGGAELALGCDFRFADTNARFGITPGAPRHRLQPHGHPPAHRPRGSGRRAPHPLLGPAPRSAARLRGGDLRPARGAPEELEAKTLEFAELLCSRSQYSIRSSKQILQRIAAGQLEDDAFTLKLRNDSFDGEDYEEGVRAFLAKRPPVFK
jgi:enoyl-CoA hydratase/carnithine racemase